MLEKTIISNTFIMLMTWFRASDGGAQDRLQVSKHVPDVTDMKSFRNYAKTKQAQNVWVNRK